MTQDVTQWLAEIQTLQQQLATARQEREEAYTSSANWRRLYETEAQQRRTEAQLTQQTIESLRAEIAQLKGGSSAGAVTSPDVTLRSEVDHLSSIPELKARLLEVLQEREQLAQALKTEQANHTQTRKSLTTALGDAVDRLTKDRAAAPATSQAEAEATDL